jgi:hypothetical protein
MPTRKGKKSPSNFCPKAHLYFLHPDGFKKDLKETLGEMKKGDATVAKNNNNQKAKMNNNQAASQNANQNQSQNSKMKNNAESNNNQSAE